MKRVLALLLAFLLLFTAGCAAGQTDVTETTVDTKATEPTQIMGNTMTGEELMQEMKIGWNLGNTFDAPDGETSWGNPFTTKELIQYVKELGFGTIRIPISWHKHVGEAPEYTIDENWLKRITTVVNDALDAGLYVIINSHHDNVIYTPTPDNADTAEGYLTAIWTQIAEHFQDADYRLIFQTMNEPRVEGASYEWWVDTKNEDSMAAVEVVNRLNQAAVDAIRATGGKNADRFIIVSPYAANATAAVMPNFQLPEDPAGKLIVSVHAYTPYNLCLNTNSDASSFNRGGEGEVKSLMSSLNRYYVSKGIPVIIDEMGIINKENPADREAWAKYYISQARENGMVCCWWDNGTTALGTEGFGIINRRKLTISEASQSAYDGLMAGLTDQEEQTDGQASE